MSSLLEDRYRRALRMLPAAYRQAWEEDMVATFLDRAYAADPDDPEGVELSSPSRAELASIAALAVRLRLGGAEAPPRSFAWGEAVRRVALMGLLAHAASALVAAAILVWVTHRLPGLSILPDVPPDWYPTTWDTLSTAGTLLWVPAYLSILHGHRRAARILALAAFTPALIFTAAELAGGPVMLPFSTCAQLLFLATPILALAAFHRDAPPVEPRPWLVALPVGVALLFAVALLSQPAAGQNPLIDPPGLWCVGLTVAAVIHLLASAAGRGSHTPPWPLALALLALAAFGLRAITLLEYLRFAAPAPAFVALAAAEAAAVLIVAITLIALATRALRHLPASAANTREMTDEDGR
jgi:hypothetical protein